MQHYKLYTLIDISDTGQNNYNIYQEINYWKRQNFNTVLQTLGMRTNIQYINKPVMIEIKGSTVGFNTDSIIRVWRFDFFTEGADIFKILDDPFGLLKQDFELVPYINGLDEDIEQNYSIFVTEGINKNIIFSF